MDETQVFIMWVIVFLLVCLVVSKRKDKKEKKSAYSFVVSDTSREYIENDLIPTMCLEDLDELLIYDDSVNTRLLIRRGYLLGRAVSQLHEVVAELEPGLFYLGHVVQRDSKVKFDAGVGNTFMLYYKPFGITSTLLLKIDVDFSDISWGRLIFFFSGPLAFEVNERFKKVWNDVEVEEEPEKEQLEIVI